VLVAQYLRARRITRARALTTRYAASCGVAAALWLGSALVPTPLRFWLWGLALSIDVVTPLITTKQIVDVPHDAAHLPERYGLFTIILMGESMVAVMTGMEHQEYWSVRAAASAMLGMGLIVGIWWCYYEGVDAAGEQMVRSRRDAMRFQAWSYGHLPLYLGIAVTGVGLEHVIAKATIEPLHSGEVAILSGALAAVMMALLLLAATRRAQRQDRSVRRATTPLHHAPHSQPQSRRPVATAHTALDTPR
jgi:low temperature requirement protein LtrA